MLKIAELAKYLYPSVSGVNWTKDVERIDCV